MNKTATVSILALVILFGSIYTYLKFDFEMIRGLFSKGPITKQDVINTSDKENILNGLSSDSQASRENTIEDRLKYLNTIQSKDSGAQVDGIVNLEERKNLLNSL